MVKPKITETDISKLTPDPNNARKRTPLSASVIRKSIEQFGMTRSIVLDENGVILAGNGAFEEAGQLGIERVIVVETTGNEIVAVKRTNLTAEQKTQYAIADNTASDFSTWDFDILNDLAQEVDLSEFFPDDKLNELLEQLGKGESFGVTEQGEENEEEIAELLDKVDEIESRVKLGEIWQLGRHKLACGDSTVESNVRALLGDRFGDVGMVWADSPYGMKLNADFSGAKSSRDFAQEKKAFGGNKYDNIIGDHDDFDPTFFLQLLGKVKEQFWWGADYYAERIQGKNDGSWFIWDKRVEESMDAVYGSAFETCWSKTKHKRQIARIKWAGIFGMEKEDTKSRVHPTQKPVALCEWFFERYGNDNDLIFDPFLGSSPSIIAAQKMEGNRTVFGFEISPQYMEVTCRRYELLTGDTAKLVGHL
jgi:site-specific DNA-methyltransferase (adenine-specific)